MAHEKGGSKTQKQLFGAWGEEQAARFLSTKGYDIVDRNFRAKGGEIDIIAWHTKERWGKTLCFVEVKTRRDGYGTAERATGYAKQQHLLHAARQYCVTRNISLDSTPIQFEQVSVYTKTGAGAPVFRWYVIPIE